jgi:transcriptional regulator GlxA family with amidase domain
MSHPTPLRIGLLIYDQVELLDHAGPYEVFTCANRMQRRLAGRDDTAAPPPFEVLSIAASAAPVAARAGLKLTPDAAFGAHGALDILLIPGGVVDAPLADAATLAWVTEQAAGAQLVASVCTGVFVLAAAGVLSAGTPVTTHWEDLDDLRRAHPQLTVHAGMRWVQGTLPPRSGESAPRPVYTSAGISAGIDLALHLVERLCGRPLAERTARQMDYRSIATPHDATVAL